MQDSSEIVIKRIASVLATYEPSEKTKAIVRTTTLLLLAGISGAGKDTMCHQLTEIGAYERLVTTTTRSPRRNHGVLEEHGKDYYFLSIEQSLQMFEKGEYIEGNIYSGNVYGTTVAEMQRIQNSGVTGVTNIDVNGVAHYKKIAPHIVTLFVVPPNFDEWQRRLLARYGNTGPDPNDLEKRMHTAIAELEHAFERPYYHFIINDDLMTAVHVADTIAHNNDRFNDVDTKVRSQVKKLLYDLRAYVS